MKAKQSGEYQYLNLLRDVLKNGTKKADRTGVGTISVFGRQMRFNLADGFPLLTTKKVFLKGILYELLWFLKADSNIRYLVQHNVHIWDQWPYKNYKIAMGKKRQTPLTQDAFIQKINDDARFAKQWGDLGPVYGVQWRRWKTPDGKMIDQIANVIDQLKRTPYSRRLIVTAWNPGEIEEIVSRNSLPPCHSLFQFYVVDDKLSCQLYQRSGDLFLGVPFNIASYALLMMMVAQVTGLGLGEFVHTLGDAHIYLNHLDQVKTQLSRQPKKFPAMKINNKVKNINNFVFEDFELVGYDPHPPIKAPVAV